MRDYPILLKLIRLITQIYFRAEIRGFENIPKGRCLFVSNHNLGFCWNPEIWIFGANYYLSDKYDLPLYGLAHHLGFKIPIVSRFIRFIGASSGRLNNAIDTLNGKNKIIVFPGGGWESFRPTQDRDKIDFKGRAGFARLAKESGVQIIPIVTAGAHDSWYIWKRGHRIAHFLKLDKLLSIDFFPIGFSFPFGFIFGPFIPYVPLPRKIKMSILKPINTDGNIESIVEEVNKVMQEELTTLAGELPRSMK
jgi:1-acyl-sn-glycerol-3-phosphate acyltransferase